MLYEGMYISNSKGVMIFLLFSIMSIFNDLIKLLTSSSDLLYFKLHFGHPDPCKCESGSCSNSPCLGHIILTCFLQLR